MGSAVLGLDSMIPEGFSSLNNSPSVGVISTHSKIGVDVEAKPTPKEVAAFTSKSWFGAEELSSLFFPKKTPNIGK